MRERARTPNGTIQRLTDMNFLNKVQQFRPGAGRQKSAADGTAQFGQLGIAQAGFTRKEMGVLREFCGTGKILQLWLQFVGDILPQIQS